MNMTNMRSFLESKIKECYARAGARACIRHNIYLYNTRTSELEYWNKGEKDVHRKENIIADLNRFANASRRHTASIRSGLIEYESLLVNKFDGVWILTYNNADGITKVEDYVNFGVKQYINSGVEEVLRNGAGLGQEACSMIYKFLDTNNIYDSSFDNKTYFILSNKNRLKTLDTLILSGVEYEGIGRMADWQPSILINNEEDSNLFKLTTNKDAFYFSISIKELREVIIEPMFSEVSKAFKTKIINRYSNAELTI